MCVMTGCCSGPRQVHGLYMYFLFYIETAQTLPVTPGPVPPMLEIPPFSLAALQTHYFILFSSVRYGRHDHLHVINGETEGQIPKLLGNLSRLLKVLD